MRPVRQPDGPSWSGLVLARSPEIRYAMPVSHSHQFLWVDVSPETTVLVFCGLAGSVTSQTSWPELGTLLPSVRRRYVLPWRSHTRAIWAPPCSGPPTAPGIWARYFGRDASVTSTIEVPLSSSAPVSGLRALPP